MSTPVGRTNNHCRKLGLIPLTRQAACLFPLSKMFMLPKIIAQLVKKYLALGKYQVLILFGAVKYAAYVIYEYIKSRGPLTDIVKQQRELQKDM